MSSDNSILVCNHINKIGIYILYFLDFIKPLMKRLHLWIFFLFVPKYNVFIYSYCEKNIQWIQTSMVQLSNAFSFSIFLLHNFPVLQSILLISYITHCFGLTYLQYDGVCQILQVFFLPSLSQSSTDFSDPIHGHPIRSPFTLHYQKKNDSI